MPGPHWLTSWVNVNNRHVAYSANSERPPNNTAKEADVVSTPKETPRSTPDLIDDQQPQHPLDNNNHLTRRRSDRKKSSETFHQQEESAFGVATALRYDGTTKSLPGDTGSSPFKQYASTKSVSFDPYRAPSNASSKHRASSSSTEHGLVGFFTAPSRDASAPSYPRLTGKYLNEAAFVQQLEQRQRADLRIVGDRREATSPPPPPTEVLPLKTARMSRSNSNSLQQSTLSIKSDASPASNNSSTLGLKIFPPSFFEQQQQTEKQLCSNCKALEEKLDAAFDDIEYLRTTALQKEYTCASCGGNGRGTATTTSASQEASAAIICTPGKVSTPPWRASSSSSASAQKRSSLGEYGNQVTEATNRHRKQVEQLTKERVRWQQDIHFKLHKFANLCKDLNEESMIRNEKAIALQQELREIKAERDAMAKEENRLRARVQELERYEAECKELKRRLLEYEEQGLRHAEAAIQSRDQMIHDLSTKLEVALDHLEMEKAQRHRRQIIFPANVGSSNGHHQKS